MAQETIRGRLVFYSETGTEGGIWSFQDERHIFPPTPEWPYERYDYEGLHFLENGDLLKIFDKENPETVIWEGEISLIRLPPFTQSVFDFWIRADQEGVERETWARWFFEEYPAELISKR